MKKLYLLMVSILLATFIAACSTQPVTYFPIESMLAQPLRVRRPVGPPASPAVEPGGEDYTSQPLPNEQMDCRKPESLIEKWKVEKTLKCLGSIRKPVSVRYLLVKASEPLFQLQVIKSEDDAENATPTCLEGDLSQILVPRELFFQSTQPPAGVQEEWKAELPALKGHEDPVWCYSTRIPIEEGKVLGIEFFPDKLYLKIDFPLPNPPRNRQELERTVAAWALTPFYYLQDPQGRIRARYVNRSFCRACFGEKNVLDKVDSATPKVMGP